MEIMLLLCKRICQWVTGIVKSYYSIYLHIFSMVITPKYIFVSLVRYRLLSLYDDTILITIEINGGHNVMNYAKFTNEIIHPNNYLCWIWGRNIPALIAESTIISFFESFQLTVLQFKKSTWPYCDLKSSLSI